MEEKLWSAIVITCSDYDSARAFHKEICLRQEMHLIHPDTITLCIADAKPNVGSGGATLNAILHITEHISALQGYTVISADVLKNERVLILHMGTTTPFSASSPAFLSLPASIENTTPTGAQYSTLATQFDILLQMTLNTVARDSPPGFWVCSCDRMIVIPPGYKVNWSNRGSVYMFAVPVDMEMVARKHGALRISNQNTVEDIIYKGCESDLVCCKLNNDLIPAVSGLVFFTIEFANVLLTLGVQPPLDGCTYLGQDAGPRQSVKRAFVSDMESQYRDETDIVLSLYFDILLCLATNVNKEDFIGGRRSGVYGTVHFPDLDNVDISLRKQARQVIWDSIAGRFKMHAEILLDGAFHYISSDPRSMQKLLLDFPYRNITTVATNILQSNSNVQQLNSSGQDGAINKSKAALNLVNYNGGFETSFVSIKFQRTSSSVELKDEDTQIVAVNTVVRGASIGQKTVLLHSSIKGDLSIGDDCMLINISSDDMPPSCHIPEGIVFQRLFLKTSISTVQSLFIMFGVGDKLQKAEFHADSTIFNQPWSEFFKRTNILPEEVWSPVMPKEKRCLLNARLFPLSHSKCKPDILVLLWLQGSNKKSQMAEYWRSCWRVSLLEILDLCDPYEEFQWRRQLSYNIGKKKAEKVLVERSSICLLPFFHTSVLNDYFIQLLQHLDKVASNSQDLAVVSRTFACIADVLGIKANGKGGLRSGPAANYNWKHAYKLLQEGFIAESVTALATQRTKWLSSPDLLVRAARHYEGAFQLLVRKSVATSRNFIKLRKADRVGMHVWVNTAAPARMAFAGGWSDTPPICFEKGGKVTMMGIKIDGQKPIGCRVMRIPSCHIVLLLGKHNPLKIICRDFEDLLNYSQPNLPGALLKAAFFCSEVLPLEQQTSLADYLSQTYEGGFVLQTWSNLPHGSGLGVSSILAGAILAALWRVVGCEYNLESLIHATLDLEQMLTTGGGWQDMVGGLCPGVKMGVCQPQLPLHVRWESIHLPDGFLATLQEHLLVVFTGKTRLARNMLQDVLRNWNTRLPGIVRTTSELVENAEQSMEALKNGDLVAIGNCLNNYWRLKKLMAHGCEPNDVREMMERLRPFVHGQSLAGAGGGGFMYVITKNANMFDTIKKEINEMEFMKDKTSVHLVEIDMEGLTMDISGRTTHLDVENL